jgi:1-acyl-sn-glycerol-3-phosphate acyltransferase
VTLLYRLCVYLIKINLDLFFHFSVEGAENLPPEGPYIVAANHVSYLDPPVVGACCIKRQVFFMAKQELFNVPLLGPVIRTLGTFPVNRESADLKSMRHAISLLKEGKVVGIFPEGGRSASGEIVEGEGGVGLLVKHARVPIIPCALMGTHKPVKFKGPIPCFNKVTARFGKPLSFDELPENLSNREKIRCFTSKVMESLENLLNA